MEQYESRDKVKLELRDIKWSIYSVWNPDIPNPELSEIRMLENQMLASTIFITNNFLYVVKWSSLVFRQLGVRISDSVWNPNTP